MESTALTRRRLAWVLYELADGHLSSIAASRRVPGLLRRIGFDEHDPDMLAFVALDSETDHLPVGPTRASWSAEALRTKDAELARHEAGSLATSVVASARALIERLDLSHWAGSTRPEPIMTVRESCQITGRGVALFAVEPVPPRTIPEGYLALIRDPFGTGDIHTVEEEAALITVSPAKEELALLVRGALPSEVPPGSRVERLCDEWP